MHVRARVSLGTRPSENWKEGLGDRRGRSVPSGMYGICNYWFVPTLFLELLAVRGPNKSQSVLQQLLSPADPAYFRSP